MKTKIVNAGNCIMCGEEIKIVAKRGGAKSPNIFLCDECKRKVIKNVRKEI